MADLLKNFKKEKKPSGEATAAKLVLNVFRKNHATSPKKAIPISDFKDVKLSTPTISFTIANFINQEVVHKTEDERYWFDEQKWQKMEKEVVRGYAFSLMIPLVLGFIVFFAVKFLF